ncbi:MAG: hypothetical protein M3065_01595 [Actinomycetota bacterium]|nr:hypothetical protein [Actinomycetota bacterium]
MILAATGHTGDGSNLGLLTATDVAQAFSSIDPDAQPDILSVLDSIEQAPSAGPFSSLSTAQQQAFISQTLSQLEVSVSPDPTFVQNYESVYADWINQVNSGTLPSEIQGIAPQWLDSDPPDPAPDLTPLPDGPALPTALILPATVLAGLEFVSFPLPLAAPSAPPLPSLTVIASLTAILPLDSLGTSDATVNQLVDELVAQVDALDTGPDPAPVIPSPLLPQATAALLS